MHNAVLRLPGSTIGQYRKLVCGTGPNLSIWLDKLAATSREAAKRYGGFLGIIKDRGMIVDATLNLQLQPGRRGCGALKGL